MQILQKKTQKKIELILKSMSSDLAELFKSVGEVCEILGKLTGPLHRLAQELENNPAVITPKKPAQRWTSVDTKSFNEARDKFGDDAEKIHAALPKKDLQEIQKKLNKLIKSESKKRKQADDSGDDRMAKKAATSTKSDSDNESQKIATVVKPKDGVVSPSKSKSNVEVVSPSKYHTTQASQQLPKSKITDPKSKSGTEKIPIKKELASPTGPSPDLGEESEGVSSDEFGA